MSRLPSISVIVPALRTAYLPQMFASIERQQYPHVDIWVVDNGPSDAVREACREGVHYIVEPVRGAARARNRGILESQGELIAFLDDDDLWTDGHLGRLVEAIEAGPGTDIAQGRIRNFRQSDDGRWYYCSPPYRYTSLASAIYRRRVFETAGLLDSSLAFGEDTDFWIRCWEEGIRKTAVEAVSLLYRRHGGNMTANKNLRELGMVQVYKRRLDRKRQGLDVNRLPAEGLKEYLGEPLAAYDSGKHELMDGEP